MRPIVLLALLGLIGAILLRRWIANTPRPVVIRAMRRTGIALIVGIFLLLMATGRLPWIIALLGALAAGVTRLLPLLRFVPLLQRLWAHHRANAGFGNQGAGSAAPQQSTAEARFVRMTLDHETGEMSGEVLAGTFAGRSMDTLELSDLAQLLLECQAADEKSAALVRAYLERVYGEDWQAQASAQKQGNTSSGQTEMTREEAHQILGLAVGASEQEIMAAHRRLMQKVHPDRGGSDYLAAKINQAKEILLGK
ncbi:DnaJ domain-containing protein [Nitrosococcus watsonii]|uniref:Heat shock protein DnaJ domain protein n=1 Tax=Nitrosococcus watsoni (strain C-113) TaxID=105559 RepID=D8K4I5_NITWC|nr:DnaJ domain-containing protein [Nitrosococcus watsonii]ADJ27882.1 heat shock protein DnaJ domain protein [Nitrosococcus watsonii C-113]